MKNGCVVSCEKNGFVQKAYRYYCSRAELSSASERQKTFHRWLKRLKHGENNAVTLFACILKHLWKPELWLPDVIVCAPGHEAYSKSRPLPLTDVIAIVCKEAHAIDRSDLVRRVRTVDPCVKNFSMRNVGVQMESMKICGELPRLAKHILVIDDVATTWSTIYSTRNVIENAFANVNISVFAFGLTRSPNSDDWPKTPIFPQLDASKEKVEEALATSLETDLRSEYDKLKFALNGANRKLHRPGCKWLKIAGDSKRIPSRTRA